MKTWPECQIYVLTKDRAQMLAQTLESLVAQSVRPHSITVVDNASADQTAGVLNAFAKFGVKHFRQESPVSVIEQFGTARRLADTDYVMIAHDDDLYHPGYLERALELFRRAPQLAFVGSRMVPTFRPTPVWTARETHGGVQIFNREKLAALFLRGVGYNFGSTIYWRRLLAGAVVPFKDYPYLWDRPLLLSLLDENDAGVMFSRLVKYRLHGNQDSKEIASRLAGRELANLFQLYRNILRRARIKQRAVYYNYTLFRIWQSRTNVRSTNIFWTDLCGLSGGRMQAVAVLFGGAVAFPFLYLRLAMAKWLSKVRR